MNPISIPVAQYMSAGPYAVGPKEPLSNARRLMEKYAIRDLPVRSEGKLVGVLAERDVQLISMLAQAPPETLAVENAMTVDPYTVAPDTPLGDVVRVMARRKLDSAVVLDGGSIVGVFTSADAMHALADALDGKLARTDERVKGAPSHPRRATRGRPAR